MAEYKGKIWGELGEYDTRAEALKEIRSSKKSQSKSKKQFPHHTASRTKYYYAIKKLSSGKYQALYRYDD